MFAQQAAFAANNTATPPADAPSNPSLPDLGRRTEQSSASIRPSTNGVTFENTFDGKKLVITPEYSNQTGLSIGATLAAMLGDKAAIGVILNAGQDKKEALLNAGFKLDARQHVMLTVGQLEQFLDYAFLSGSEKVGVTQTSGALSYQFQLGDEFLRFLEVSGYVAKTASRDLVGKTFTVDTATLFELWNEPRRIAGGEVTGLQARLSLSPLEGSLVKVSLGQERLNYDLLSGSESVNRLTGGVEWVQQLGRGFQFKAGLEAFASQDRYTLGLERSLLGREGRQTVGVSLVGLRGRDGVGDDRQLKLNYTYLFGGTASHSAAPTARANAAPQQASSSSAADLLNRVSVRPSFIPAHVVAKVDASAAPTRLIAVVKTALPPGSSVNTTTGDITAPLGVEVTAIAGVSKNGAAFANAGQFSLSGNSLLVKPALLEQPAAGVVDSYAITLSNAGGGTTLATVLVSRGSVKIDSITVTPGVAADTTAPVTTAAPSVSGTSISGTTLSVTLNETGTGYYLVQAAAAAAPTVAAVQAGTPMAMSANVAATAVLGGLSASTAYKIYFVAKDAANNVQTAVQSVAVTTLAAAPAADTTAPATTAAPAVSGTSSTASTLSVTVNENGTGYYLVQAAAAAAPTVAAVQAGTSFAMTANVAATTSISGLTANTAYRIYFVAKDAANNVQAAVQSVALTTIAAPDLTAPTTTVTPSVSGTSSASTTLSVTVDETGTGYYLVQAASAATPTVAAVQAGTSFAMTANVAATAVISGLAADTAYKIYFVAKDAANNVQATVQSVAVTTLAVVVADTTAPTTTAGPSVSGTTDTVTTLSVTVNESGTGYYLVQAAAAAAPTVAAVQAGTSFALTANVAATPLISGLSGSTAYKIYFVAKDAANNVQAAVQSVAVSTTAAPDTTPPLSTSAPAISVAATATTASVTQTINENGTGYWLLLPAAAGAPTVAAVKAGTAFAMSAATPAVVSLSSLAASTAYKYYFVAKDAANNDQAAVSAGLAITTTAAPDITAPTAPTLTSTPQYTNANSTSVEVNGEVAASVWVNGVNSGAVIAGNGKVSINLDTSDADGVKNFAITLKDAALNVSGALNVGVTKDTVAPSKTGESFPTAFNWRGGSGTISFDEAIAQVTSVQFKNTTESSGVAATNVSVASGVGTSTITITINRFTSNYYSGDQGYIELIIVDAAGNSRTVTTNNYDLFGGP